MRRLCEMETVQIETTSACLLSCSNCTRFCGHKAPFFMEPEPFKAAIDSMVDFPAVIGLMGGEPLLHPRFEEYCEYALAKIVAVTDTLDTEEVELRACEELQTALLTSATVVDSLWGEAAAVSVNGRWTQGENLEAK